MLCFRQHRPIRPASVQTALPRYRIDLQRLHAECELNHARLWKIFPAMAGDEERLLALPGLGSAGLRRLQLRVTERSPYTTCLDIVASGQGPAWGLDAVFQVRLYADARMAEVTAFQRQRAAASRYAYPNPAMRQPDEKAQWNFLLGEWLVHVLAHGYPVDQMPAWQPDSSPCPRT